MSDDELRTMANFVPHEPRPPSLPPEGKVTLQLALSILLGLLVLLAAVGGLLGVVDKSAVSNVISVSVGGVLGLLTGGSKPAR